MFRIVEPHSECRRTTNTNNIRDIYDIVMNITNSKLLAGQAAYYASNMAFGDMYDFGAFMLECQES